jgi:hypothetical protein
MPNWSGIGTIATIVSCLDRDDNSLFDYTQRQTMEDNMK